MTPLGTLRALASLRRSLALYPKGHVVIDQSADELEREVRAVIAAYGRFRVELVAGTAHIDGYPFRLESLANRDIIDDMSDTGVQCLQIDPSVTREELIEAARILNGLADGGPGSDELARTLESGGLRHVTFTRLVPIAAEQGGAKEWPSLPAEVSDPGYAEVLEQASRSLGEVFDGEVPDAGEVGSLLDAITEQVEAGGVALREVLAIKRYENHTYCHSVNVASLSILLGRRLGLDATALAMLGEGALLHDVGKRGVPVEILRKPGPLNQREWRILQRHPALGAELLASAGGFSALTPTIALEHHREFGGGGYPDLGTLAPHPISQIVAVADTYEALTGARAYRDPLVPDEACLILARMAGKKLDPALVRAFVSLVTFFPLGSLVRTSRDEVGVVVETSETEPLHPVIVLVGEEGGAGTPGDRIDTAERSAAGEYLRHVVETLPRTVPAAVEEDGSISTAPSTRRPSLEPTRWEKGSRGGRRPARPRDRVAEVR
ncbi:MAG: HD-GYP domain-containing protein [Gemmatimonadota bacterium]|nr:HD-GYP domain-containing protein [Gemmatimonadota bacterium]